MNLWEFIAKRPLTPVDYTLYGPQYSFSSKEEAEAEYFTKRICASLGYTLEAYDMPHTYGLCVKIHANWYLRQYYNDKALNLGAWPKALASACAFIGGASSAEEVMLKLDMLAKEAMK